MEAAASKIAKKTGKPYLIPQFGDKSVLDTVMADLKKHGLSDTEELEDPLTGMKKQILVGDVYVGKLRHHVRKKFSARGLDNYTSEGRPGKGGHASAQSIGVLDSYALMAHGASEVMDDVTGIKSQRNDDWWNAFMTGMPLPAPEKSFVTEKFEAYLKGAGVNLTREGSTLKATPLTDKDVLKQSKGAITNASVLNTKDLSPEKGGLFDPSRERGDFARQN